MSVFSATFGVLLLSLISLGEIGATAGGKIFLLGVSIFGFEGTLFGVKAVESISFLLKSMFSWKIQIINWQPRASEAKVETRNSNRNCEFLSEQK